MHNATQQLLPWYREPWPWLLMAGPVAVIFAGIATVWIAVVSSDGLVVDDYYKQGLAINQTLERGALAARLGYRGELHLAADARSVSLRLEAGESAVLPAQLQLRVVHPTRAGRDGLVLLRQQSPGQYGGAVPELSAGRWILVLEDMQSSWRIGGTLTVPASAAATLLPDNPG
ncbi:MAG: FixH family protein [Burkholderiales bacterium]|nr:FixH family protein [Burkholderiales bacterium]